MRSAVDEISTWGEGRKTQAGGGLSPNPAASLGSRLARRNAWAAGEARELRADPGRLNTAKGIDAAIVCQPRQR